MKRIVLIIAGSMIAITLLLTGISGKTNELEYSFREKLLNSFNGTGKVSDTNGINQILIDIHHMSHKVVVADEKWGSKPLTLENINKVLGSLKQIDPEKKEEKVLEILLRWQSGDFSQAHKDHNYVWARMGGTVGVATSVDVQAIPNWAKELNNK